MSSKSKNQKKILCVVFLILGKLGLVVSSFGLLVAVFFHRAFDHWMLFRELAIFFVSISFLLIAAHVAGDGSYAKRLLKWLPLGVTSFACLGLAHFLGKLYLHRNPHHLGNYEFDLFLMSVVGFAFCLWCFYLESRKRFNESRLFIPSNPEISARRILKPGTRPYIALGILFGALALFLMCVGIRAGDIIGAAKIATAIIAMYGVLCLWFAGQRIIVGDDYIAFKKIFGRSARGIYFKDITKSHTHRLAEQYHPIFLEIYTGDSKRPALGIPLKPFKLGDVKWLLSMPELKFHK